VRVQSGQFSPLKLQLETDNGWSEEQTMVDVQDARLFRTWIGIKESTLDKDFLPRHVQKLLGALNLALRISGEDVERKLVL